MKRITIVLVLALLMITSLFAATMSVQVNSTAMRGSPSFMGPVVQSLSYGDRVEVIEEGRGWIRVRAAGGSSGWVQESALSRKRIVLSSGSNVSSGASTEEVALAGKGFNEDVEKEYRSQSDLDYSWVDKMEEWERPVESLIAFLEEGDLEGALQ